MRGRPLRPARGAGTVVLAGGARGSALFPLADFVTDRIQIARSWHERLARVFPLAFVPAQLPGGAGKPPTAFSYACATRRHMPSAKWRPTIIMPTGKPSPRPAGTEVAGCPLTSKGAVLAIISRERASCSSRLASADGIVEATMGS